MYLKQSGCLNRVVFNYDSTVYTVLVRVLWFPLKPRLVSETYFMPNAPKVDKTGKVHACSFELHFIDKIA